MLLKNGSTKRIPKLSECRSREGQKGGLCCENSLKSVYRKNLFPVLIFFWCECYLEFMGFTLSLNANTSNRRIPITSQDFLMLNLPTCFGVKCSCQAKCKKCRLLGKRPREVDEQVSGISSGFASIQICVKRWMNNWHWRWIGPFWIVHFVGLFAATLFCFHVVDQARR